LPREITSPFSRSIYIYKKKEIKIASAEKKKIEKNALLCHVVWWYQGTREGRETIRRETKMMIYLF
jgi:hypothetical protein